MTIASTSFEAAICSEARGFEAAVCRSTRLRANRRLEGRYLPRGRGVLPLPARAMEVDKLAVVRLSKNPLGAVRVDEGLGLATYRVRVGPDAPLDAPPTGFDMAVPAAESVAVARIAADLGLAGRPPAERLAAVAAFFRTRFRYSTYADRPAGPRPLEDLLRRRPPRAF